MVDDDELCASSTVGHLRFDALSHGPVAPFRRPIFPFHLLANRRSGLLRGLRTQFPNFAALGQPLEATALYCGMKWQPYFSLHNTFTCDEVTLKAGAQAYRQRLIDWQTANPVQIMEGQANG